MDEPTIVELFAGISGFGIGFERAGFRTVCQVEIERNCQRLLKSKNPDAIQIDDVRRLIAAVRRFKGKPEWQRIFAVLRAASLWCGGFPCQDLSVAGQRAGLAGERSGLWFSFRRLIALFRPPLVVIENVPGLLSSNQGRDFAIILCGLGELGYRWAYRTLDAQYFGLAQRRERVFIVASLASWRCAEILFERESLCWDSPPSRETGKRITGTLRARSQAGGGLGSDFEIGGGWSRTLRATTERTQKHSSQQRLRQSRESQTGGELMDQDARQTTQKASLPISGPVTAKWSKGGGPSGDEAYNLVTNTLKAEGADASEDGTGRGVPSIPILEVGAGTSSRGAGQSVHQHAVAFAQNQREELRTMQVASSQSGIRRGDAKNETLIAFPQNLSATQCASAEDISPAVAFTERTRADGRNFECQHGVMYALTNPGSGGRTHSRQIATQSTVRRLTPTECERLQGFTDGYTEGFSDSVRYRMLGNAVAVPVAHWLAFRVKESLRNEKCGAG